MHTLFRFIIILMMMSSMFLFGMFYGCVIADSDKEDEDE